MIYSYDYDGCVFDLFQDRNPSGFLTKGGSEQLFTFRTDDIRLRESTKEYFETISDQITTAEWRLTEKSIDPYD